MRAVAACGPHLGAALGQTACTVSLADLDEREVVQLRGARQREQTWPPMAGVERKHQIQLGQKW